MSTMTPERRLRERVARILGKEIVFTDAIGRADSEQNGVFTISFLGNENDNKPVRILVSDIETKGSKYYANNKFFTFNSDEYLAKVEQQEQATAGMASFVPANSGGDQGDAPKADIEPIETEEGVVSFEPLKRTCQFCRHKYLVDADGDPIGTNGMTIPKDGSDVCPQCAEMAEDDLLAAGVGPVELTIPRILEYLVHRYGLVQGDMKIVLSASSEGNLAALLSHVSEQLPAGEEEPAQLPADVVYEDALADTARTIAKMVRNISGEEAEINYDTNLDSYVITGDGVEFCLTAICGGYKTITEEGIKVKSEEFISLDTFFEELSEVYGVTLETGAADDLADLDEAGHVDDEEEDNNILKVGSYHRLQNCKNGDNNGKLVKVVAIIEKDEPDDTQIYQVAERKGKTHKVSEAKLKPATPKNPF